MINTTNLLAQKFNKPVLDTTVQRPADKAPVAEASTNKNNILASYLQNLSNLNKTMVVTKPEIKPTATAKVQNAESSQKIVYHNNLRSMIQSNSANILAIVPRTFNAKDTNGNGYIDGNEQCGTFLNAIDRLDEVKADGFNTLHLLPINPPGKLKAMGTAGSVYSPLDLLEIDPMLIDKNDPRSPKEQVKAFVDECHKRDIKVMVDLPSCASYEMFTQHPEWMAMERDGLAKTPQGWNDIRMFQPWEDESKRTLNPKLLELHKQFVDMCIDLGIDGIRADVARAKPVEFWDIIIPYSRMRDPQFGWLAETYTYEDASPQTNMPYDRPEDSLRAGFDMIYGQYHIFHEWPDAKTFMNYVKENLDMSYRLNPGKTVMGSFATHDDISPMFHGGADYCKMTAGLQAGLPMLNMYQVDGFQNGDYYIYPWANKFSAKTQTDNHEMTVHEGKLDIFNLSRKPGGHDESIRTFMRAANKLRADNKELLGRQGTFIELDKVGDKNDQIITFARHYRGKTLLWVANKNVDRAVACTIKIPTLKADQQLDNMLPSYGHESIFQAKDGELKVDVGPARVHVFEIDTPDIENHTRKVYKQR